MIITDRSRIESWFDCPRKRYWMYEFLGWGVVPDGPPPEDLAYGIAFHEGAEMLMIGKSLSEALNAGYKHIDLIQGITVDGIPKRDEFRALFYGHLRTLSEQFMPRILERYDVVSVEEEIALPLGPDVVDATRLDVGLREKETGDIYYVEWKTDSNPSDIGPRMEYNLQFVLGVAALRKVLGERVVGSLIVGVDKGQKRGPTESEREDGKSGYRRESPFTYAYFKDNGWSKEWRLKWTKNWKKTPVWTVIGLDEWYKLLQEMNPVISLEQFTISTPVRWTPESFASAAEQIVTLERRIDEGCRSIQTSGITTAQRESILNQYFPMNRKNCRNDGGYKRTCPFAEMCHLRQGLSPLDWGFTWRVENHPLEATIRNRPLIN